MAVAPSPTAEATRLTDRCRTSPAANTPGTLVSSSSGGRFSGQPAGSSPGLVQVPAGENEPVPVPLHAAFQPGGARFGTDHHEQRGYRHDFGGTARAVPQGQALQAARPPPPMTSVPVRTAMLAVLLISVTRYWTCWRAGPGRARAMVTDAAYLARWRAA